MRNHETTFSLILSPTVGSYEFILVTVVTCFQLKERDVSFGLPGPLTVTEHLGRHATQRPDPLLKQRKLSFSHLQALAPASPAASSAPPRPLLLSSSSPSASTSRKSSRIPFHLSNGHKVFPAWVRKSELRQTRVLEPCALVSVDEDCSWCSCCLPGHRNSGLGLAFSPCPESRSEEGMWIPTG